MFSPRFVSFHDRHDAVIVLKLFAPGGNEDIIDSCLKPLAEHFHEEWPQLHITGLAKAFPSQKHHVFFLRQSFRQTLMMSFGMTCDLPNRNVAAIGTQHVEGTLQVTNRPPVEHHLV